VLRDVTIIGDEPCPLPADPVLAEVASAYHQAGCWCSMYDAAWRWIYMTDELRLANDGRGALCTFPMGAHVIEPATINTALGWRYGGWTIDGLRRLTAGMGPWMLADTPGGREALSAIADPRLRDVIDTLSPDPGAIARTFTVPWVMVGGSREDALAYVLERVRDEKGTVVGNLLQAKPNVGMATIATMVMQGDLRHFQRMNAVAQAGRRPAAILFADLEQSAELARRLSTANYFALVRRLVRAADQAMIDWGGLVGRHVGDGVVAFFLAETAGSESAAARDCIGAARAVSSALHAVVARSELSPEDVVLRFGLHWGSMLYVGNIATAGRTEVTALGDEVNECARIEACATGGRMLASKDLIERLDRDDAAAIEIEPSRITYTQLGALPTATEKARRDAPAVAVAEI
jgi:class 3 adenylate cyclase